jgi:hypothetical protein
LTIPKRITTSRKRNDRLKKANRKNIAGQTMIYKTVHRKVKAEQHKPHLNPGVKSGALKGLAIPAPFSLVVTVVIERCHSKCNLEMENYISF